MLEADPLFALHHMHHTEEQLDNIKGKKANTAEEKGEEKLLILLHSASTIAAATNAQILWKNMHPTELFFPPSSSSTNMYIGILTDKDKVKANQHPRLCSSPQGLSIENCQSKL
eukprot:14955582-Ditylum_brightwellii.AAC.1